MGPGVTREDLEGGRLLLGLEGVVTSFRERRGEPVGGYVNLGKPGRDEPTMTDHSPERCFHGLNGLNACLMFKGKVPPYPILRDGILDAC